MTQSGPRSEQGRREVKSPPSARVSLHAKHSIFGTIELVDAVLFLGDHHTREAELLPVVDGVAIRVSKVETNLELGLDSALAILGRDARDFYLRAAAVRAGTMWRGMRIIEH